MLIHNDRLMMALIHGVIGAVVDMENDYPDHAKVFWRNLEVHLIHVHNAMPESAQPLRDAIRRIYPRLRDRAAMLREHLDSMSPEEQKEGYERRDHLEIYLGLKDFLEEYE